ncbi:HTH-type transcriptional repressor nemR [Actinomyces bovis]|uniref:HTH-type transcriptional repressor nemR n=1 Tax=Actinomyces bovis TaxID=1658 RepID=A0ABY1VPG7_9ACTO|nr:TetR/AcrR family transcriptional regulator [Actinomyces bovis]SPT53541.1 HTH-type transcriptional repressor nemR [Actinomyces bovis]VEG55503.1 HTH-type transcriptional repressor nemR [Actinomyces israelii]
MSDSEQSPGVTDALHDLTQAVGSLARALTRDALDTSTTAQARAFNQVSRQLQEAADTLTKKADAASGRLKRDRTSTQEEILAATKRVVAAKGFAGASMADIAAEARFTKGAIYGSFSSKEELLLAAADRHYELQQEQLSEHYVNGTTPQTWEEMCREGGTVDITFALEIILFAIRNPVGRAHTARHISELLQAAARLCVKTDGQEPGPEHQVFAFIMSSVFSMAGLYSAILGPENAKDIFTHAARLLESLGDSLTRLE